jgi:hypothetical protein
VLGWQAHYDCHRGAVELRAPCGGCDTVAVGEVTCCEHRCP